MTGVGKQLLGLARGHFLFAMSLPADGPLPGSPLAAFALHFLSCHAGQFKGEGRAGERLPQGLRSLPHS